MTTTVERIRETWGDHDDFEEGGYPYVAFIIEQDLQDMEDADWDEQVCKRELADICINALRMLDEKGYFPTQVMNQRLEDHQEKGTKELVGRYQTLYEDSRTMATEPDYTADPRYDLVEDGYITDSEFLTMDIQVLNKKYEKVYGSLSKAFISEVDDGGR